MREFPDVLFYHKNECFSKNEDSYPNVTQIHILPGPQASGQTLLLTECRNTSAPILPSKGSSFPVCTAFFGGGRLEQASGRQKPKQRSWYTSAFLSNAQCVCCPVCLPGFVLGSWPHTAEQSLPWRGGKVTWRLKFGDTFYKRSSVVCVNSFLFV